MAEKINFRLKVLSLLLLLLILLACEKKNITWNAIFSEENLELHKEQQRVVKTLAKETRKLRIYELWI